MEEIRSFTAFLQACIAPMVLVSGVGLLLLSLTNRLGRTIDRSRLLVQELENGRQRRRAERLRQLRIMYRRSKLLRSSIVAISFSILTSSLIIPVLVVMSLTDLNLHTLGMVLFLLSVIGIVLSAIFLFVDVTLSLQALKYEVRDMLANDACLPDNSVIQDP